MLVRVARPGLSFEQPISKLGHRTCQNNSIIFENCREPRKRLRGGRRRFHHQQGFHLVCPVAAIARSESPVSAYEYVLKWSKTYTAGGGKPILTPSGVGLCHGRRRDEDRSLSGGLLVKAAHYLDLHDSEAMQSAQCRKCCVANS